MEPKELDALIQRLQGLKPEEDAEEQAIAEQAVADALHGGAPDVYQVVFNAGHSRATAQERTAREKLEAERDAEKAKREAAEKKLQEAEGDRPDAKKIREEYEAEMEKLKGEHEEALNVERQARMAERRARTMADLTNVLSGDPEHGGFGVDSVYAGALIRDPDLEKRLRWDDDGNLEVLQPGKEAIPIPGDEPLKALAAEIAGKVPPKYKRASTDTGGGQDSNGGGGGGDFYSQHRKKVEAERKKEAGQRGEAFSEAIQKRG